MEPLPAVPAMRPFPVVGWEMAESARSKPYLKRRMCNGNSYGDWRPVGR